MKIELNYSNVKNDGQSHLMWENGNIKVFGDAGEFGNISLKVCVSGIPYLHTYSYHDVRRFIEEHFNQP